MNFDELNAKDIYELFSTLYNEKHKVEYQGAGWIGNEMHSLRNVLDEYGSAQVACSALNCIINNDRTVNIPYFTAGIKYYLTSYNPIIYYAVTRWGTSEIKKLWRHYLLLESVWFPSATQRTERKIILKELKEWANAKTTEKKRKTDSKTTKQKKKPSGGAKV